MKYAYLFGLVAFAALTGHAATIQWTNTLGGDWFTPANWSPNAVPGAGDTANITLAGTYTVTIAAGSPAVRTLNLGGASGTQNLVEGSGNVLSVTNAGTVGPNGVLTVNSGGLQGNLTVQSGGQLFFATTALKTLASLTLFNQGAVTWSGGQINGGGAPSTVINNSGSWQVTGDNVFVFGVGGLPMFWTNSGTLSKTGGTGVSQINSFNFVNQPGGVVSALTGTLSFTGDTNSILGGSFSATSPGLVSIGGGTWTDAGGIAAGSGINQFNGGTLNLRTNIIPGLKLTGGSVFVTGTNTFQQAGAITNLTLDGATLHGTNQVGNGLLTVNAGAISDQLTVSPGGQLALATAALKTLASLTLLNQGTVVWSGGQINGGGAPSTVISNGGLWQATGDNVFVFGVGGFSMFWTNSGTLSKTGGTGVSQINSFNFVNQPGGLVSVLSGTLSLSGDTNSILGGSLSATSPGLLSIGGGTWTDAGGIASGSGNNQFNGGTLNLRTNIIPGLKLTGGSVVVTGTSTFQQAGAITNLTLEGATLHGTNLVGNGFLTVNAGAISDQLTVSPGGQLALATAAIKTLASLTLFNQGTVTWSGGQINGGGTPSTVINNSGSWQVTGDNVFVFGVGGLSMFWTNSGTLSKTAGAGVSQINSFNFVNQPGGVVSALTGTLSLSGDTNSILGGSLSATSPGVFSIGGGIWTDAGGIASGSGINQFNGGTLNLRTNIILGLKLVGGSVFVTGTNTFQQAGAITNLTLDGATLRGTNQVGNGLLTANAGAIIDQLTVSPGGQLVLATAATKTLASLALFNQGNVIWSGGQINGGGTPSTVISNGGSWQATGDNVFVLGVGGLPMFWTNYGTLSKTGGAGVSQINSFNFINQAGGLVSALTGTLSLNGDTNSILGGSLSATSPGLFNIAGGIWTDAGGVASGSGINQFNGGTLNLRTNIIPGLKLTGGGVFVTGPGTFQQSGAITNLTLDGATLHGTNQVGNGLLTVNAGAISEQLTVSPGGQLVLATAATKTLASLTLFNQGTVTWSGGQINGGGTPSTVISNGGSWQVTGNDVFVFGVGGLPMFWTNSGTLRKTGGTGLSQINNFTFVNQPAGLVQADTGTLQLPANTTNSAGTLRLNGGTLQGGGPLTLNGGTLDGAGSFGANSVLGGVISPGQGGAGLMGFTSGLNLGPGATLMIDGTGIVPGSQYDQLSVTGAVSLGSCTLLVTALPAVPAGTTFVLIANDAAEAVSGTFSGLPENALLAVSGQSFRIHYAGGSGNDVTLVRDAGAAGPQLTGGGYANGLFSLSGVGGSSVIYSIRASTNLVQWTNLGSVTSSVSGNFSFTDSNAALFPRRFYNTTN